MSIRAAGFSLLSPDRRHLTVLLVVALTILSAACLAGLAGDAPAARPRAPTTWYVSRHGNGTAGSSWAQAWREPAAINWSIVRPGDQILIDGGPTRCPSNYGFGQYATTRPGVSCGMLYLTGLSVQASGTSAAPISIRVSSAPGRNGTAVLFGGRATPLPYCDQVGYAAVGRARPAGISIPGRSHIIIDGSHRSGLMVYGAQAGVDLESDRTSFITLRNLELFDNGTYRTWTYGYKTDGEGVSLAGHNIVIDRDLIHDNGQDAIQDRYTGVRAIGHAPLHDITVSNSWLYEHRQHPRFAGFGFNAGAQEVTDQDCTHVDGLQIWGGGLHQRNMTFSHDVFGPFLAQGVYPGDNETTSFDHVIVSDSLFLNVLDHAIIGPAITADPTTPEGWRIRKVTAYLTDQPTLGLKSHGKVDLAGSGHSLTDSVFYNGYFARASSFSSAHGNLWWGGDPVVGGSHRNPQFVGVLPTGRAPSYRSLTTMNLTPRCASCTAVGSSLHTTRDLLNRIDNLDRTDAR